MTTDNFDSFAKTCERFVDILRYDEYHLDVVGAILRLAELHKQEIAAHGREVAELRECLKEAIREKCPFTRMSCKHDEPCDYECGTKKWRKALEGANDETK